MSNKKLFCVLSVLMLFVFVVSAFAAEPQKGGTLRIASQAVTHLDIQSVAQEGEAFDFLFESLYQFDENWDPQPYLAESSEVSDDALTHTIKLREGIKFQDGTDFNAEAAKWNLDRKIDLKLPYYDEVPWESIEAIDEYTLQIKLTRPFLNLYQYLCLRSFAMYSPAFVQAHSEEDLKNQACGTGPFVIDDYLPGDHLYLVKNENYWDLDKIYLDRIEMTFSSDTNTRFLMLEAGEVDFIRDISFIEQDSLEGNDEVKTMTANCTNDIHFSLHNQYPPLDNPEVRKAFNYAVDKEGMNNSIYGGRLVLSDSLTTVIKGMEGYKSEPVYEYNPELAKQILDEQGLIDTNGDGYREFNGEEKEFILFTRKGKRYGDIETAEQLQAMLGEVGINVKIEILDSANYFTVLNQPFGEAPYYDMSLQSPGNFMGDAEYAGVFTRCNAWPGNLYNYSHYCNPEFDALLDKGNEQLTLEERNKYYYDAIDIFWNDAPDIFLFNAWMSAGYAKNLEGFWPDGAHSYWVLKYAYFTE